MMLKDAARSNCAFYPTQATGVR